MRTACSHAVHGTARTARAAHVRHSGPRFLAHAVAEGRRDHLRAAVQRSADLRAEGRGRIRRPVSDSKCTSEGARKRHSTQTACAGVGHWQWQRTHGRSTEPQRKAPCAPRWSCRRARTRTAPSSGRASDCATGPRKPKRSAGHRRYARSPTKHPPPARTSAAIPTSQPDKCVTNNEDRNDNDSYIDSDQNCYENNFGGASLIYPPSDCLTSPHLAPPPSLPLLTL